jgi:hypothetical protein
LKCVHRQTALTVTINKARMAWQCEGSQASDGRQLPAWGNGDGGINQPMEPAEG